MAGLWYKNPETRGGKFLVLRRDGSVPEWPYLVIGARDPAGPAALRAYADEADKLGFDPQMVADVRDLASVFEDYRRHFGAGDPDAPRHRVDDPDVIEKMRNGA